MNDNYMDCTAYNLYKPVLGIDISEHNGAINWATVSSLVDFVILRAGYGKNGVDQRFYRNAEACNQYGIPIGVYWFSYACSVRDAEIEALSCLEKIKPFHLDYPVVFDWEDDSLRVATRAGVQIHDKQLPTAYANKFLSIVEKAGYIPCLYTNPAYLNQYFGDSLLDKYSFWLAKWPGVDVDVTRRPSEHGHFAHIWQYSAKGKLEGIHADVDLDVCYVDYPKMIKERNKTMTAEEVYNLLTEKLNFEKQAAWADIEIAKAKKWGFTDGKNPYTIPSRAEVMTMISRALDIGTGLIGDGTLVESVAPFTEIVELKEEIHLLNDRLYEIAQALKK